jgi:hypothetical protein
MNGGLLGNVEQDSRMLRPLGSMERLMHLYARDHPRHFCVAAELSGSLDVDRLQDAFAAVKRRHPLLSVSIDHQRGALPVVCQSPEPINIDVRRWRNGLRWQSLLEDELVRPFVDGVGPLMRAIVLVGSDRALVLMTFHHALSDGMSAVYIVGDLMQALDRQPLRRLHDIASLDMRAAAASNGVFFGGDEADAIAVDHEELRAIGRSALWRPFESDRVAISSCCLDGEPLIGLRAACRQRGTTVHGALCAAVARRGPARYPDASFTIANAINLRDAIGSGQGECGLLASIALVTLNAPKKQPFWELARQVTEGIAPARTLESAIAGIQRRDAALPESADSVLAAGVIGAMNYNVVVTNLGVLPIPTQVGALRLESFWGPAVQGRLKNEIVIGAATVGGRLHLLQSGPRHQRSILAEVREDLATAGAAA